MGGLRRWLVVAGSVALAATGSIAPLTAVAAGATTGPRLPSHIFTPYFEAYTTDSPWQLSRESGAHYLTLAFLQTARHGSCAASS